MTIIGRRLTRRLAIRLGLEPATRPPALLAELTRFFLGELIQERTRYLAVPSQRPESEPADTLADVTANYERCLQTALGQQVVSRHAAGHRGAPPSLMSARELYLPGPLGDEHFASPRAFARLVRRLRSDLSWRGGLRAGPVPARDAAAVASAVLAAAQAVALGIVRDEYATPGLEVPETTERLVRAQLLRIAALAHRVQATPPPRTLGDAEVELRVHVARAAKRLYLPLRSIPTAPLDGEDLERHYAGRPDDEARRLARQIRQADGAILVTGYRGVGKSSFVNRALFHAEAAQAEPAADGWVLVPVGVNLAKASGVERILRLTLRAARAALLDPDSATPRPIPGGRDGRLLPLHDAEITRLQEAYIRATLRVSLARSTVEEQKWEVGGKISVDPGRLIGLELGKFLSAGLGKSRADKINREVSLLDYDENTAEGDLAALITSLATPRPLGPGGLAVRLKLVFVFDELDKMNVDTGLMPMIEGLKNLFLQQHAVFMLITSKRLYYALLKDRAVEDALLNSYFSAIVHVPLLTAAQVRAMLDDWIFALPQRPAPGSREDRVLDQLSRYLTYRSFGNPRDIIRELRQMQEWADTSERPYLAERVAMRPELPIFAALQEAIELLAAPSSMATAAGDAAGTIALASERLGGDAARLEQVRRGLYILTEEIINRQTMPLTSEILGPLQRDNFSLLLVADVQQLASRLGAELSSLWAKLSAEAFAALSPGQPPTPVPLFALDTQGDVVTLKTSSAFYALTGRQATAAGPQAREGLAPAPTAEALIEQAEALAEHGGRAERLSAIAIIGHLGPAKTSKRLKDFLIRVVHEESDPGLRLAAVGRLTPALAFEDPTLLGRVLSEQDERVIMLWIRLLAAASAPAERRVATTTLLSLLTGAAAGRPALSDALEVEALGALPGVADRDLVGPLLEWLCAKSRSEAVATAALTTLKANAESFKVDLADRVVSSETFLRFFLTGASKAGWLTFLFAPALSRGLEELVSRQPLAYVDKILAAAADIPVGGLLARAWRAAFDGNARAAADFVVARLMAGLRGPERRLQASLAAVAGYPTAVLPQLLQALDRLQGADTAEQIDAVRAEIKTLSAPRVPKHRSLVPSVEQLLGLHETPEQLGLGELAGEIARARAAAGLPPWPVATRAATRTPSWSSIATAPARLLGSMEPSHVAALFLSVIPFLATLAIPWDLPANATWSTILLSRTLLVLADAALLGPVLPILWPAEVIDAFGRSATDPKSVLGYAAALLPLIALGVLTETHQRWVGPVVLWHQVAIFAVNLVGFVLLIYAFTGGASLPRRSGADKI